MCTVFQTESVTPDSSVRPASHRAHEKSKNRKVSSKSHAKSQKQGSFSYMFNGQLPPPQPPAFSQMPPPQVKTFSDFIDIAFSLGYDFTKSGPGNLISKM